MTRLRKMMLEELERRNYSEGTTRRYLRFVERFAQHFGKSPDKLGPDHLRSYRAHLFKQRRLSPGSVEHRISALRFFFVHTLGRRGFYQFLPFPKVRRKHLTVEASSQTLAARARTTRLHCSDEIGKHVRCAHLQKLCRPRRHSGVHRGYAESFGADVLTRMLENAVWKNPQSSSANLHGVAAKCFKQRWVN